MYSDVLSRHAKGHKQSPTTVGAQVSRPPVAATPIIAADNATANTRIPIPAFSTSTRETPLASGLSSSLDYLADISAHHGRSETELNTLIIDEQQPYYGWNEAPPADSTQRAGLAFNPVPPAPKDMLQLWLEPRTDTASNSSLDLMHENQLPLMNDNLILTPDLHRRSVESKVGSDNIPNERFFKVQRCWLAPPSAGRLINSLWRDTAMSSVDNIFSVQSLHFSDDTNAGQGSRCGFDEDCRRRLQAAYGHDAHSQHTNTGISPGTPVSASHYSSFPPAEIFDMSLDHYFRLFHPLLPFVHAPTFSANKTRPSLLYVMTLVGMTLLGTKGTTAFVSRNFSVGFVSGIIPLTNEFSDCSG